MSRFQPDPPAQWVRIQRGPPEHITEARRELCRKLSWDEHSWRHRDPIPPGFTEHVSPDDEVSYEISVPQFCRDLGVGWLIGVPSYTFIRMIRQMAILSYIVCPEGWQGPMVREDEERTSSGSSEEGMLAWQESSDNHTDIGIHHRFLEKSPPWNPTLRNIFETEHGRQAWTHEGYLGILREFIPRILGAVDYFDSPSLDSPLLPEHIQFLGTVSYYNDGESWEREPYSTSAIAHDDGTRQEIVDHNDDEYDESSLFHSDDEYPMEEPLSDKEIQKRDKCSKIIQILEGIIETEECKLCEGKYLEMCNILKELYNL